MKHYIPHIIGLVILAAYMLAGNLTTLTQVTASVREASSKLLQPHP